MCRLLVQTRVIGSRIDNDPDLPRQRDLLPTNLPAYDLLSCYPVAVPAAVGECTLATSPDIDLETLDEVGGVPGDNLYNTADGRPSEECPTLSS